jgi:HSP20 family protein
MKTEIQKRDNQNQALSRRDNFASPFSFIDRFFDDFAWDPFNIMTPSLFRSRALGNVSMAFPKVDVEETDNEIKVTANIPGVDPKDINVEVGDDYLSLSGKIEKESKDEKNGKIYRYEREYGEFRREFSLPARVNKDSITAKSKNGVLTITLPKSEDERKTKVRVEVEQ